eukprot:g47806.t1
MAGAECAGCVVQQQWIKLGPGRQRWIKSGQARQPRAGQWQWHEVGRKAQSETLAVAWSGPESPERDSGSGMEWAGKPGAGLWQWHGMGWKARSGTLAAAWRRPESLERDSGSGMARAGKPGAGLWQRHGEGRKTRSGTLAEAWRGPESRKDYSSGKLDCLKEGLPELREQTAEGTTANGTAMKIRSIQEAGKGGTQRSWSAVRPEVITEKNQVSSVDVDGSVFSSLLSEVNDQFFHSADVQRQIVFIAPRHQVLYLSSVFWLIIVRYPSHYASELVSKLVDGF